MGDELEDVDLQNYKGIYFNDDPSRKYQDKATGAHFEFNQMCARLQTVYISRKKEMQRERERGNKWGVSRNETMSQTVDQRGNPIKQSSTMRAQPSVASKRVPLAMQEQNIIEGRKATKNQSYGLQHQNPGALYHHTHNHNHNQNHNQNQNHSHNQNHNQNYKRNEGEHERHTMSGINNEESHKESTTISSQVLQELKEGLKNMQKTKNSGHSNNPHDGHHRNSALTMYDKSKGLPGAVVTMNDNAYNKQRNKGEIQRSGSSKPRGEQQRKTREGEVLHTYHKSSGCPNMQHCRNASKGGTKSSMQYYKEEGESIPHPQITDPTHSTHHSQQYSDLQFKANYIKTTPSLRKQPVITHAQPSQPVNEVDPDYNALEYTLGNKENSELIPDISDTSLYLYHIYTSIVRKRRSSTRKCSRNSI